MPVNRHPRRASCRSTERGSVVLAMVVLMVIGSLAVALLLRAQSDLATTATLQRTDRASLAAERGVVEALALVRAGERGTFDGSGAGDGVDAYRFEAQQVAVDRFVVVASAEVDGEARTLRAEIAGTLDRSDDALVTTRVSFASDNGRGTVDGAVATAGVMTIDGLAPGERQYLLGPAASCDGCTAPVAFDDAPDLSEPARPGGAVRPCPADWSGAVIDGDGGTPIVCDDPTTPVVIGTTVEVTDGPLVIWVGPGVDVDLRGARLNPSGPIDDLVLAIASDRSGPAPLLLDDAAVRGAIVAPGRDVDIDRLTVEGRLTLGSIRVLPLGSLDVADAATSPAPFSWDVVSWEVSE